MIINVILSLAKLSVTQTELDKRDYNASLYNIQRYFQRCSRCPLLQLREREKSPVYESVKIEFLKPRAQSEMSEMLSCGGDEDLHLKQIATHQSSPELESDIPSLVLQFSSLHFDVFYRQYVTTSIATTNLLLCLLSLQFYNQHLSLPPLLASQPLTH